MVKDLKKALGFVLAVCLFGIAPGVGLAQDFSLALYGGRLTTEKWESAISPGVDFADATIIAAAGSWTVSRFLDGRLSCELEVQVGKYFGD